MKILLNETIEGLGRLGDIVEVKAGYARNYLLPRKKALHPTKHNLEVMKYKKVKAEKQLELDKLDAMERKTKIETLSISIEKKAGDSDTLFGSVTTKELQAKLEELGVTVERKKIHLDEPIKKLGIHTIKIKLVEEIEAEVKVEVLREGGELEDAPAEVVEEVEVEEDYVHPYRDETEYSHDTAEYREIYEDDD